MQNSFTKGQQVWQFRNWDDTTVSYRLVTIESWGKKAGTVSLCENGRMSKSRVYTELLAKPRRQVDYGGEHYFAATPDFDPQAKALELAAVLISDHIATCRDRLQRPFYNNAEHWTAEIAKFEAATPAALSRPSL